MQRLINFRAFLFIFIGAIVGTLFAYQIFQKNTLVLIISSVIIFGLLIFLLLTSYINKIKKFQFLNKFLICLLIGFFVFLCLGYINIYSFNNNLEDIKTANVSARVCYKSERSGSYYLILEDAQIENIETNKITKLNGKISLLIYSDDFSNSFAIGDKIDFTGTLVASNLIKKGKFNSYLYKNNIKYFSYINKDDYSLTNGNMHIDEKVRERVKTLLFENLSYNNASIAYASIFGDKTMLDQKIMDGFSNSGTAHLLCVSGLHVGFIITLLYFFFNLLKLKKKYIFIILSVLLLFYCYLCGFSSSVVRASIMSLVLAGSACLGDCRYDNLNSLGFAGVIILAFSPFMIFDVGFKLSFASCFGIFLLMPVFEKLFKKINFYNKFTSLLCLTLSAQIGTFPIILHNFESLSFLSVMANIIVVPLFSIIFMILIIFILINLILPFGFLFKIIEVGLNLIALLTKSFGSVSTTIYYDNGYEIFINIAFYLILIFASGLVNIKNKTKILNMIICVIIISFSVFLGFMPKNYNFASIINTSNDDFTIITNSHNEKVLVITDKCDINDYSDIKKDLMHYKIFNLNAIIVGYYNSNSQECITKICNDYAVEKLYVYTLTDLDEKNLFDNLKQTQIIKTENEYQSLNNYTFKILGNIKSVELNLLENDRVFNLFITGNVTKAVFAYITTNEVTANYFKAKYINSKYLSCVNNFDKIISKNKIYEQNCFSLSQINDILKLGENIKYGI